MFNMNILKIFPLVLILLILHQDMGVPQSVDIPPSVESNGYSEILISQMKTVGISMKYFKEHYKRNKSKNDFMLRIYYDTINDTFDSVYSNVSMLNNESINPLSNSNKFMNDLNSFHNILFNFTDFIITEIQESDCYDTNILLANLLNQCVLYVNKIYKLSDEQTIHTRIISLGSKMLDSFESRTNEKNYIAKDGRISKEILIAYCNLVNKNVFALRKQKVNELFDNLSRREISLTIKLGKLTDDRLFDHVKIETTKELVKLHLDYIVLLSKSLHPVSSHIH